ncbi:serine/threonine-protein kinase [Micropruina sonneratiae]|uniref:serine/threonine-protein kinase n=1 Tax=Micropruina sonneratiae TaxID=2986940 RepID=UPI002226688A|nr:serine/threonine-protein kinase [Micropruina sp. KQZ13P-5]MCW3159379.1 serine/threonine protein kinase [Micropruina sp. KQZ13P-5]
MAEHLLAGRYRLEHEIGAGGMGRVWRARDVRLDREVAVKTVDLSGVSDPTLADRFQREIVLTARLTSPHTVTVFDGGVDGRTAYLVMELLRGESLADAIARRGPLGLTQTLDVARQVTRGLAAAHAVGLVHRDIKPANVMLGDGRVKLLDFGIAQLTGQVDPHLTAPQMTIGTAAYMSPEQAAGQRVDAATDLYALGCLIMTMLTGRPPFPGDQPVLVASAQINAEPPRLASRRSDVPPGLDALVAALLAKNPLLRPNTAATLRALEALQANQSGPAVQLPPPASGPVTAPGRPAPVPQTRPYTQPAPAAGRPAPALAAPRSLEHLQPSGAWWLAGVLVSLILALLVAGLTANLTGAAVAQLAGALSSGSPEAKPSTTKPTPSASADSSPDPGQSVALGAALQGVRLALSSLPDSEAKTRLLEAWEAASARIAAGRTPKATLTAFEKAVKASGLAGWEQQAVLAATGIVRSLL